MPGRKTFPFSMTASGIVGPEASAAPVRLHSAFLTETGGTTNLTLSLYVPTATGNAKPGAPSAGGTLAHTFIVPKGTTMLIPGISDEGMCFEYGLYIACAGGTPSLLFAIS